MNSISIQNNSLDLHVVNEDYFPLKIVNDPSVESTKYVEFCFGDTDLLEFSIDRETNEIKKILLVLCNHFEIFDERFQSENDFETGCISINLPQRNECDAFVVMVFRNAVKILLSKQSVKRTIRSGRVLFGLTADNDLASVTVTGMNELEITHTTEELKYGS